MIPVDRLQAFLYESARQRYEAVSVPCLTLFFHPTDPLTYFNYAIPDKPCGSDLGDSLIALEREFAARGRRPRFEFIQEFAPELAAALYAAGWTKEACQPLMVCTAETVRPAPPVPGLTIAELGRSSPVGEMQECLTIQRQGFGSLQSEAATEDEAERFLHTMGEGKAFVARLNGQPVGAGMYTTPLDGLSEIVGLATLEPFRNRGIATALTAWAVRCALEQGIQVVLLTAADERAGRVYERVGFCRQATMLACIL